MCPLRLHSGCSTATQWNFTGACFNSGSALFQFAGSLPVLCKNQGVKSQPCSTFTTVYFDLYYQAASYKVPNQVWGTQQLDNTNDLLEALLVHKLLLLCLVPTGFFILYFTWQCPGEEEGFGCCRGMHKAPVEEQDNNGAGYTQSGDRHFSGDTSCRSWGQLVPLCVCALFIDHIGYIFLKTKKMIFLHHQNLQKLEKKNLFFAVHSKAEVFPLSSPLGPKAGSLEGIGRLDLCYEVMTESFQHICLWGQT